MDFLTPQFLVAVGQIILIDILLGGDNAIVIALACRGLPPHLRRKGILWGTAGAIGLRVVLIAAALWLLQVPFLKIVGALLLVWIGVKLLVDETNHHDNLASTDKLWGAIKTILFADVVMSVDNVLAVAGAAEQSGGDNKMALVVFGILLSIPIIVWGSQLVLKLMDRFPIVILLGGALLGWIAGTMFVTDPALLAYMPMEASAKPGAPSEVLSLVRYSAGIFGAILVVGLGKWFASRRKAPHQAG